MNRTPQQIAWLAGLLEGEGCFGAYKKEPKGQKSLKIGLSMSDKDIVERVAYIFNKPMYIERRNQKGRKLQYICDLHGNKAAAWMMTIYKFMGERRKDRIRELLQYWRVQKGRAPRPLRG